MSEGSTAPFDLQADEFVRVPGLLRRWEIEQVLEDGSDLRVEAAGEAEDGTPLYAVYRRREQAPEKPAR